MTSTRSVTLLAGDIGGTKTRLAVFSAAGGPRTSLAQAEFPSAHYPALEAIIREFLTGAGIPVNYACFDVAGPVLEGKAKVTNLPWIIDADSICAELQCGGVWLLNDLEALARAVPLLEAEDLETLNAAAPAPGGAIAVIAPGTGLGEGFLTWNGARYQAHPSEGGHADFAPTNELEIGLLQYLQRKYSHVSFEWVCSGKGMPNIYHYLRDSGYAPETPAVARRLAAAEDPTPVIAAAALDPRAPCPLCAATFHLFVAVLGAEASNLALKVLATGGVYLGGGIPKRILPLLRGGPFMEAFTRKGRFHDLLAQIPVHVILRKGAAMLGTAQYGLEMGQA
jgi:glucokinase